MDRNLVGIVRFKRSSPTGICLQSTMSATNRPNVTRTRNPALYLDSIKLLSIGYIRRRIVATKAECTIRESSVVEIQIVAMLNTEVDSHAIGEVVMFCLE